MRTKIKLRLFLHKHLAALFLTALFLCGALLPRFGLSLYSAYAEPLEQADAFGGASAALSEENGTTGKNYAYSVEITFGAFAFYYDYGVWDVNELDYVKDPSSSAPAADTQDGRPGWYGFDGISNRITVAYSSESDPESYLDVSVIYRPADGVGGVNMTGYRDAAFDELIQEKPEGLAPGESGYFFRVKAGEGVTDTEADLRGVATYFSFSGIPWDTAGDAPLSTANRQIIGTITLAVSEIGYASGA